MNQKNNYIFIILLMLFAIRQGDARQLRNVHINFSGRQLIGNLGSSKFTEYRTLPAGIFLDSLSLSLSNADYTKSMSLWGSTFGQYDHSATVRAELRGRLNVLVGWNQIPHNYSNTARTIYSGAGTGALEIPKDIRYRLRTMLSTDVNPAVPGVQFDTTALANTINGMARSAEIISRRDKIKVSTIYTPTDEIDVRFDYTNERRDGTKPLGGLFFFHIPIELIEPTQYRTQEASARIQYTTNMWNAQLGYTFSFFGNTIDALAWDNPFRENDFIGATSRGRIDLYPQSSSQTITLVGGARFPFSTSLATSVSYSLRKQDDRFIPYTINTAIESLATLPKLPAESLNGKVGISMVNISLTNRFLPVAWFSARYRSLTYNNQTPKLQFPGYVDQDNLITKIQRQNLLVDYRKTNTSADVTFRPISGVSIKPGIEQEHWLRNYGETENTREQFYKLSVDYSLSYRWILKSSYAFSVKKNDSYDWATEEQDMYPAGLPAGIVGQLPLLRKFDLADRERTRVSILGQFSPSEFLAMTGSFGLKNDFFKESAYGLLWNKSHDFSLSMTFSPTYDLSFSSSYTRENFTYAMKSRQRRPGNDTPDNDWASDMSDKVQTFTLTTIWAVVPEKIDLSFDLQFSDAQGTVATRALGDPTIAGFLVTTAQNYPDTRSIVRQATLSLSYRFIEHLSCRAAYRFEGYTESYFGKDIMEPYMVMYPNTEPRAVYLGATQPGFSAHLLSLGLVYDF